MKIFVDDLREPPSRDWIVFRSMDTAFEFLMDTLSDEMPACHMRVTHISLDHDMGQDENGKDFTNGYQFLTRLEEAVVDPLESFHYLPVITIHSANPQGSANMEAALKSIGRYATFSDI